MSPRVLMVDDEQDLLWGLSRQMQHERPDLDFEGLCDPEQALTRLQQVPPDVLVTDVRMPKMNGIELLLAARRFIPALPVVVVTAYGNADVRASVNGAPSVQYLEKPFAFAALVAAIERALHQPAGFSGAISLPMLPDLVQIYALSQMCGALSIRRGAHQGVIWFERGEIVHAECDDVVGVDAVYRLLRWEGGTFSLDQGAHVGKRTIHTAWLELLVEGCRQMDEARRDVSGGEEAVVPAAVTGPGGPGALDAQVADLWRTLGPLVAAAAPEALVLAVRPAQGWSGPLQGAGGVAGVDWPAAVAAHVDAAARVAGEAPHGSVEWVSHELGLAIVWDRERDLALVFADVFRSAGAVPRLRSNLARWRDACRPWLDSG